MAKDKEAQEQPQEVPAGSPPTPEQIAEAAPLREPDAPVRKSDEERGYKENAWNGMPHYECLQCPFDTMVEDDMLVHVQEMHNPVTRRYVPVSQQIYDRFGNVITERRV